MNDRGSKLAENITRAASPHTYDTIRFLVDRDRVTDAYRAYAYFRWVDDTIDSPVGSRTDRLAFARRQKALLDDLCRGVGRNDLCAEETLLAGLLSHSPDRRSGLHSYLHNMMAVMLFDAGRRDRTISQMELAGYTAQLACAVTEAMHHFIGHSCYSPHDDSRYLAVSAAHVTHMLRDARDDLRAGYFNIPREVLDAAHITPNDMDSEAYRRWVTGRVELAREHFRTGRNYLERLGSWRCRLAGLAYTARFAGLLDIIKRDSFRLRDSYPDPSGLPALAGAITPLISSLFAPRRTSGALSGRG